MKDIKRRTASSSAAPFVQTSRRRALSQPSGQKARFLAVGRVVAPRGVRGELKVRPETEDAHRFALLDEVLLGEQRRPFAVRGVRFFGGLVLLRLEGVNDREQAEARRGAVVWIPQEQGLALEEGQYYYHQIEGLTAVTVEGEVLGRVIQVLPTGANDVYVVRGDRQDILLPAIRDVIAQVDLEAGRLVVRLLEGLR